MKRYLTIIALLIIVGLIFIIIGCSQKETEVKTPEVVPEPELVPPQLPAAEPEIVEQPQPQEQVVITETLREEAPTELLTQVRCVDNKIEGVVTNVDDEQMDLSDSIIYINGILKRNPECDTMILNPGDSTFCENFIGNIKPSTSKGNKLILRISGLQWEEIINCE